MGKEAFQLITKVLREPNYYLIEEFSVDPNKKEMTQTSCNITLSRLLEMEERCVYKANVGSTTLFEQTAVTTSHTPGLKTRIEDYVTKRFLDNALLVSSSLFLAVRPGVCFLCVY